MGGLFGCCQELFHLEQEKIKADQNNSRLVSYYPLPPNVWFSMAVRERARARTREREREKLKLKEGGSE